MEEKQVLDPDEYTDPKPAGSPCKDCDYCEPNPEVMVLVPWCWKRSMQSNPLGTCNHWGGEPVMPQLPSK